MRNQRNKSAALNAAEVTTGAYKRLRRKMGAEEFDARLEGCRKAVSGLKVRLPDDGFTTVLMLIVGIEKNNGL